MNTIQKPIVIIIDDHQLFNDGIKTLLDSKFEIIQLNTVVNASFQVLKHKPEVVLMDYNMPKMNGIDGTNLLLKDFPELKIIFLSMSEDSYIVNKFIKAGASGFISKTANKNVFLEIIDKVIAGEKCFPDIKNKTILDPNFYHLRLTNRELEIAELVRTGISTKEIATKLAISPLTVETHRKNILAKFGVSGEMELYKYLKEMEK
jgi:two-component system, NarL family, nitrate/nitrite response regulator NarL